MIRKLALALAATAIAALPSTANSEGRNWHGDWNRGYGHQWRGYYPAYRYHPPYRYRSVRYVYPVYRTRVVVPAYGYGYSPYGYGYGYPAYGYGYPAYGYPAYYGGYGYGCPNPAAGAVAGGLAGAVIGSSVADGGRHWYRHSGDRAAGAIVGGALGAVVGGAIASSSC